MAMKCKGHFLYFAFGSNLLKERLKLNSPSAEFQCVGRLKDYGINFGFNGEQMDNHWHGGAATIEERTGADVWGVVWRISNDNLHSLDKQEGVDVGMYTPLVLPVETDQGQIFCRTYQMNHFRASPPSPQYKQVICWGAHQNGLPSDYIDKLEAVQTNSYSGPSVLDEIQLMAS